MILTALKPLPTAPYVGMRLFCEKSRLCYRVVSLEYGGKPYSTIDGVTVHLVTVANETTGIESTHFAEVLRSELKGTQA